MSNNSNYFTTVLKSLFIVFFFILITIGMFSYYSYLLHLPKDIEKYTYTDSVLSFTLAPNTVLFMEMSRSLMEYELTLPKDAHFNPDDHLSVVMIHEYHTPKKDLSTDPMYTRYRVKPVEHHKSKEIALYINGILKYDLKDNVVLKQKFKDPHTGIVTESIFQ